MPKVVWTRSALRDVERLHQFLATKNRDAAKRAVRAIRQSVRGLAVHPEIGRPMEDMLPHYRERLIPFGKGAYLALYRYDDETVAILAVRHAREAGY